MARVPPEKETVMVLSAAERQRRYQERQTAWGPLGDKITPDPPKHLAENHGCYREIFCFAAKGLIYDDFRNIEREIVKRQRHRRNE